MSATLPPTPDPHAVGHERDLARGRSLVWAVVGVVALLGASLGAMALLLAWMTRAPRDVDAPASVVNAAAPDRGAPMLQPSIGHDRKDNDDLREMRQQENAVFEHLGWTIDPKTGREQVPAAIVERLTNAPTTKPTTRNSPIDGVGVDERPGARLPLDATLRDESGRTIALGDCFRTGRPVVLTFADFDCPRLCAMTLTQLTRGLNALPEPAGAAFDVVAVSLDPRESSSSASMKKARVLSGYRWPDSSDGWHFLTGDAATLDAIAIASAAGVRVRRGADGAIVQPACTAIVTPDGRISRYFLALDFPPTELNDALHAAELGLIAPERDAATFYCVPPSVEGGRSRTIVAGLRAMSVVALVGVAGLIAGLQRHVARRAGGVA